MDEQGQKNALEKIDSLIIEGATNIWDGLFKGLEVIRKSYDPMRNCAVFLLTDG